MSAVLALILSAVTLGSCWASYRLGQADILDRIRRRDERRWERHRRWSEFYDED